VFLLLFFLRSGSYCNRFINQSNPSIDPNQKRKEEEEKYKRTSIQEQVSVG